MKVLVVHTRHFNKRGHNPFLVQPANTFYAFKILKRTVIQGGAINVLPYTRQTEPILFEMS